MSTGPGQAPSNQARAARNSTLRVVLGLVILIVLPILMTGWGWYQWLHAPLVLEEPELAYEIPAGSAFTRVSNDLAQQGIIEHPRVYSWYARLVGQAANIRAGEYLLQDGASPIDLLNQFVAGDVRLYSFTIVEGWTFEELMGELAKSEILDSTLTYDADGNQLTSSSWTNKGCMRASIIPNLGMRVLTILLHTNSIKN